jgi:oligopeptide transport system substrate-binding protein
MKQLALVGLSLIIAAVTGCACPLPSISKTTTSGTVGGNLNLYGTDPFTLDPALAADGVSNEYILQIFSGLVKLDDNLEPVPDIASGWDISPDGLTYTFHLRQDVSFQDGRKVTASDFIYAWERAASPSTGSTTAATYLGDIQGVSDMLAGRNKSLSGVAAADDYTLRVRLTSPRSYFLAKLSYSTSFVVDSKNVAKGQTWWQQPNGTGPFRLKEYTHGQQLVLERNDLYYGERAQLNSVTFALLAGVPLDMYELGKLDVTGTGLYYYDRVTDPANPLHEELTIIPQLSLEYIAFNCSQPPFDDANIRKAFSMAVNKVKLVSLLYRGTVSPAAGVLPPGMPGFNEYLIGLAFDTGRAKELIAASRYGGVANLPPITLTTSGYGGTISAELEAIIYEWQVNLGVDVEVRELDPEYFNYNFKTERDQLVYFGWSADYAHPQNFLEVLFGTGSYYNTGDYSNPAFDKLLAEAAVEPDTAKSLAKYQQAEQLLVQDAACLPLWASNAYILTKSYVRGYKPNALGFVMLNKVSLTK